MIPRIPRDPIGSNKENREIFLLKLLRPRLANIRFFCVLKFPLKVCLAFGKKRCFLSKVKKKKNETMAVVNTAPSTF